MDVDGFVARPIIVFGGVDAVGGTFDVVVVVVVVVVVGGGGRDDYLVCFVVHYYLFVAFVVVVVVVVSITSEGVQHHVPGTNNEREAIW